MWRVGRYYEECRRIKTIDKDNLSIARVNSVIWLDMWLEALPLSRVCIGAKWIANGRRKSLKHQMCKYTKMYQSNTQNSIMFIVVLGQHVSILIESSSGFSKSTVPTAHFKRC